MIHVPSVQYTIPWSLHHHPQALDNYDLIFTFWSLSKRYKLETFSRQSF